MTERCDVPEIRRLVEAEEDPRLVEMYEEVVKDCLIGDWAESERAWIELCPDFSNLKGVACDEIDEYILSFPTEQMLRSDWEKQIRSMLTDFRVKRRNLHERGETLEELEQRTKDRLVSFLRDTLPADKIADLERVSSEESNPEDIFWWAFKFYEAGSREMGSPRSREFVTDYLKDIKVFDRDEEYIAMKRLGFELAGRIWDNLDNDEKDKLGKVMNISRSLYGEHWSDLTPTEKEKWKDQFFYFDKDTIYVTTPRGGHEVLSIFSYANDLKKRSIPSDIFDREGERYGRTWLKAKSSDLQDLARAKRIVFVDDIVASGAQMSVVSNILKKEFPDAELYSVHLCHRDEPVNIINIPEDNRVWYEDTIGVDAWSDCRKWMSVKRDWEAVDKNWSDLSFESKARVFEWFGGASYDEIMGDVDDIEEEIEEKDIDDIMMNNYMSADALRQDIDRKIESLTMRCDVDTITCIFPHACPDGRSDKLITMLMGSDRCSPEKRIEEREM